MKKLMFLLLSLSIFFAGCDNDVFYPDSEMNVDLKSGHLKMVPIKGELQSHVTQYSDGIPVIGNISGRLSHLGKLVAGESEWITTDLTVDETTIIWEMTGALCAANGDLMYYNLTGVFDMVENQLIAHSEVEGGTGRFEFAEGYTDLTGYAEFDADNPMLITSMHMEAQGVISNVGSSKN